MNTRKQSVKLARRTDALLRDAYKWLMCRWWKMQACAALVLLCSSGAIAQTVVTGTVTDPTGIPYQQAQVQITLVSAAAGTPISSATAAGSSIPTQMLTGTDGDGAFIVTLTANASITPANTQWSFRVCLLPGSQRPAGAGSLCFTALPLTVAGATQDVSGQMAVAALPVQSATLTFNGELRDRFNRANASTLGPLWAPLFFANQGVLGSLCIVATLATGCTDDEFYYQNVFARALPQSQYAQFELGDVTAGFELSLLLRVTPASAAAPNPAISEYLAGFQLASGVHQYVIVRWVQNTIVFLRLNTVITPNWAVGDVLRFDAVALPNGNTELRLYRNGILFDVVTDTNPLTGSYAGLSASLIGTFAAGVRNFIAGQSLARPEPATRTLAQLGSAVDSEQVFCSDCTFANPCAGGGTGAIAKRLNGAWRCD